MLTQFASSWTQERVRLSDIIDAMEDRVYGIVLLALAIPNIIPGAAIILGIPLVIITGQLTLGYSKPRLPDFFGRRSMATADFRSFVAKADPWLEKVERLVRRRGEGLFHGVFLRLLGLIALVMAIILTLPIWGANFLPSLTLALVGIALIEHDGIFAAAALVTAAASCFVAFGVVYAAVKLGIFVVMQAFS